ncbi:hypothetical protein [Nannocystis pusilla]|uniref:hypothetical protein n=1 Tax=Nannocystis pusilla TaxID=889268 RepID=UPI003B7EBAA9
MPLYLVRWAGLHASLVSAPNEEELLNILDQVDDPGGCSFEPYRGPVWIDFELPFEVQDVTPEKLVATDISDYTVEPTKEYSGYMSLEELRTEVPACDWTIAMRQNVLRFAFPNLQGWLEEQAEDVRDDERPAEAFPASLRTALVADLEPLVRYSQRAAEIEARTDHEAQVMRDLNVTMVPPAWTSGDAEDELAQLEKRGRGSLKP